MTWETAAWSAGEPLTEGTPHWADVLPLPPGVAETLGLPYRMPPREPEEAWVFTFGSGQRLMACRPVPGDEWEPAGAGLSLMGWYVRLPGTFAEARQKMIATFGGCWCDQYPDSPDTDAMIARYELRELVIT